MTTGQEFVEAAVRCQRRAEIEALRGNFRLSNSYLRRRDYAARKATALGRDPWKAVSRAVGLMFHSFSHLAVQP